MELDGSADEAWPGDGGGSSSQEKDMARFFSPMVWGLFFFFGIPRL